MGGPPILTGTAGKLGDDLIAGKNWTGGRFASIPAFTLAPGAEREGQVRRQCTKEYKVEVIERVIRREIFGLRPGQRFPEGTKVHQIMGLSRDEPGRIVRAKARYQGIWWAEPHFPLFDPLEMTRGDCVAYLESRGVVAPRSACVLCPFHTNAEWRQVRAVPEDWARACEIDEALRAPGNIVNRNMDAAMYLHRSCRPLREAPIDTPESRGEQYLFGFAQECEGMCGV